jgi:hypothetical protein
MIPLSLSYLGWHYTKGVKDYFHVAGNFLWFLYHFFSIPVLSKTLLSPWQRQGEAYRGGFDIGAFFETFIVNTIMRVVGFFVRGFVIVFGLLLILILFVLEIILFVTWIFLPAIIILLFVSGMRLLFQ